MNKFGSIWKFRSAWALIIANLYPLYGVAFQNWSIADLLLIYWAESAVIGFFNAIKMILAGNLRPDQFTPKFFTVPFFIVHYGGFMMVHLLFIGLLITMGQGSFSYNPVELFTERFTSLYPAIAGLYISHALSFAFNYIGKEERKDATIAGLMFQPYRRITIMHLTILLGAFMVLIFRSNIGALLLLVGLKTVTDLLAHLNERYKFIHVVESHHKNSNLTRVSPLFNWIDTILASAIFGYMCYFAATHFRSILGL